MNINLLYITLFKLIIKNIHYSAKFANQIKAIQISFQTVYKVVHNFVAELC